jgi:hypothetical protein
MKRREKNVEFRAEDYSFNFGRMKMLPYGRRRKVQQSNKSKKPKGYCFPHNCECPDCGEHRPVRARERRKNKITVAELQNKY